MYVRMYVVGSVCKIHKRTARDDEISHLQETLQEEMRARVAELLEGLGSHRPGCVVSEPTIGSDAVGIHVSCAD